MNFKIALILCSTVLISACGDTDNSTPPAELTDYKQTVQPRVNWSHSLGGGTDAFHKILPTIVNGDVFTVSAQGLVSKISASTGQIQWQKSLNLKVYSGLAASAELIALVSSDGMLSVYENSLDMPLVWQKHVRSEVNVQPVIQQSNLYVRLSDGQLLSFDLASGKQHWSVSRRVPKLSLTGSSQPFIVDNLVYSGFDNGTLVAFDQANGDAAWDKTISVPKGRSELDRMVDLDGQFVIKNGVVYVSTFQGRLAAIQAEDGSELWSRPMSSIKQINADDDAIYITDHESTLWSIDRRTGAALWKQEALHHRQLTGMTVIQDQVVVADFEGYAHFLNKQTGELSARLTVTDGKVLNPPILKNDHVFFLDTSNQLTSVRLAQ